MYTLNIDYNDFTFDCVLYYGALLSENESIFGLKTSIDIKQQSKKNRIKDTKKNGNDFRLYFNTLTYGSYKIPFETHEINITVLEPTDKPIIDGTYYSYMDICLEGNNKELLTRFIEKSVKYYNENIRQRGRDTDEISIYIWDEYWDILHKQKKRSLNTLYFEDTFLKKVTMKFESFLKKETEDKYSKLGIPYKMNVLFEGYPGTGKTSLIYGLASHFDMNIAILHFDKEISDTVFLRALKRLPENTVLILEDIDVLFKERKENDNNKSLLTFSGLINCLDGIATPYKLITLMTTNYKCNLDKALLRPGRIDYSLNFKYATKHQIQKMFNAFYPQFEDKFQDFYKKIKIFNITTATLQQYLFGYMDEDSYEILNENIHELEEMSKIHKYDDMNLNIYS
jgi:hypothetical protein